LSGVDGVGELRPLVLLVVLAVLPLLPLTKSPQLRLRLPNAVLHLREGIIRGGLLLDCRLLLHPRKDLLLLAHKLRVLGLELLSLSLGFLATGSLFVKRLVRDVIDLFLWGIGLGLAFWFSVGLGFRLLGRLLFNGLLRPFLGRDFSCGCSGITLLVCVVLGTA
jgi:hypothetical protein